jgi:hypothetical protein
MIVPFPRKRVIDIARRQRRIDNQNFQGFPEQVVEFLTEDAGFFTSI